MKIKDTWVRIETKSLIEAWSNKSTNIGYDSGGTLYIWSDKSFFHDKIQTISCSSKSAARSKAYEIMDPFSY